MIVKTHEKNISHQKRSTTEWTPKNVPNNVENE